MATLFAFSGGNISTAGALNSAHTTIASPGTVGSTLSTNKPLIATTAYTLNTPFFGVALCLSSVGTIVSSDILTIRYSTSEYNFPVSGLSTGTYSNSYVTSQPQAMVGWVLFKFGGYTLIDTAVPKLSVYGPSYIKLLGASVTAPASIIVYGPYANVSQPADIVYLTKTLDLGGITINKNFSGYLSAANVYICDGVTSNNTFNISNNAANNIYIGRGGIFTGSAVVTGTTGNINQYINVLDGGILSASYATPTITGRIRAVSGAIVDLTNVAGFGMKAAGVYNNTANPNIPFDYLHDITTGYAKFNNTIFSTGISASNLVASPNNLSAINCTFQGKYVYNNTLTSYNDNFISLENGGIINNVLLDGVTGNGDLSLLGNFNNFTLKNSSFNKKLSLLSSNFAESTISNATFLPNSESDAILLESNTNLPAFYNTLINNRKTGIKKYDSCNLQLNGLTCLSTYYYSIYATDLTGELSDVLIKDSTYGGFDIFSNTTSDELVVNGLTAARISNEVIYNNPNIGTSVRSLCAPYTGGSSLLLSSISARVVATLPKMLSYDDDLTIETWYNPISSKLVGNQSLISIWDPLSTTNSGLGCVLGLYLNTAGQLILQKGLSSNGTLYPFATAGTSFALGNNKWYHIALTKDSDLYTIYFDGHFVLSANTPADSNLEFFQTINTGTYNLYIGARPISRTTFGESLCGYIGATKLSYGVKYKGEFIPQNNNFETDAGTLYNLNASFSGTYSLMPRVFIDLKNSELRYPLYFNNLKFTSNNVLSSSIFDISNSTFAKFEINNSDLSTNGNLFVMGSNVDYVEGSYLFNKCQFLSDVVNDGNIVNYQPFTDKESGFAVQNANGYANNHYRWTRGGKISLDASTTYSDKSTEKLESISDEYPLKSSLKMIPVSPNSTVRGITLTYKTSQGYVSGACLKVSKNTLLGISEDAVIGALPSTNDTWNTITLSLSNQNTSTWNQKSYLESYVELIGAGKQLHIAKWQISNL